MIDTDKVWLITGSSSGFGRALAQAALERGYRVVATARQPEQIQELRDRYPDRVLTVALDVTNEQSVQQAVAAALDTYDRIDVLVNNAGYGTFGAIEEFSVDDIRQQFEVNFFGLLDVTRAVLPTMREQRSGHILNISSVGGFASFSGAGIYSSSKFALEGASEAAMDGKQPGDPVKAVAAMIQVVESDDPPLRLALGEDVVNGITKKLESMKADLEQWKDVSIDTALLS
jgi:NADP-dependent 3-hydroxy acid dehydrogenase YdfG